MQHYMRLSPQRWGEWQVAYLVGIFKWKGPANLVYTSRAGFSLLAESQGIAATFSCVWMSAELSPRRLLPGICLCYLMQHPIYCSTRHLSLTQFHPPVLGWFYVQFVKMILNYIHILGGTCSLLESPADWISTPSPPLLLLIKIPENMRRKTDSFWQWTFNNYSPTMAFQSVISSLRWSYRIGLWWSLNGKFPKWSNRKNTCPAQRSARVSSAHKWTACRQSQTAHVSVFKNKQIILPAR